MLKLPSCCVFTAAGSLFWTLGPKQNNLLPFRVYNEVPMIYRCPYDQDPATSCRWPCTDHLELSKKLPKKQTPPTRDLQLFGQVAKSAMLVWSVIWSMAFGRLERSKVGCMDMLTWCVLHDMTSTCTRAFHRKNVAQRIHSRDEVRSTGSEAWSSQKDVICNIQYNTV